MSQIDYFNAEVGVTNWLFNVDFFSEDVVRIFQTSQSKWKVSYQTPFLKK